MKNEMGVTKVVEGRNECRTQARSPTDIPGMWHFVLLI
jgi:hypothetical protein